MARLTMIHAPSEAPELAFAAEELAAVLGERGHNVEILSSFEERPGGRQIRLTTAVRIGDESAAPAASDGYTARFDSKSTYRIVGGGATGAMYGGLDAADRLASAGWDGLEERSVEPRVGRRGLKMNVPLDGRTPAFDDAGHAAYHNYRTVWELGFWERFFDEMARSRLNVLTLWNKHPFPSLVSVPEYPDVALEDVYVPQFPKRLDISPCRRTGPEVPVERASRLSMDEKVTHWRRVFDRAAARGIDVHLITWNVCVDGTDGHYGITDEQENDTTIDYLRTSVRELVSTYPALAGIGTTAGEDMVDRDDAYDREQWLWATYGRGVRDAKDRCADLEVPFIHRVWQSDVDRIVRDFVEKYPDPVTFSFKYAKAHCYSDPDPPFADDLIASLREHNIDCWWNVRNDDQFCFRWGDPAYVDRFVDNFPTDVTAGYYLGSDGYVWGRRFADLVPVDSDLELEKHWYAHRIWGTTGYESRSSSYYRDLIDRRFPAAEADPLFDAWQAASRIVPRVNRVHWEDWDFQWSPEGCFGHEGFHTVRDFIEGRPMPGTDVAPIAADVADDASGTTPTAVADALEADADRALELAARSLRDPLGNAGPALHSTVVDVRAVAWLGRYYAAKIRGAIALATFEHDGDPADKRRAVEELEAASDRWEAYARLASRQYRPQLLSRPGWLNWWAAIEDVEADVRIAKNA